MCHIVMPLFKALSFSSKLADQCMIFRNVVILISSMDIGVVGIIKNQLEEI